MKEMMYSELVEVYDNLALTSKRLEKVRVLAEFLKKLKKEGKSEWIYLIKGRAVPDYDSREIGISTQLAIKAIGNSFGIRNDDVVKKYRKIGDLGEIAEEFSSKRKQGNLFSGKLSVGKVFENLRKIMIIEGKGAVDKKLGLISEILALSSSKDAKYIIRTLLSDLRVGVADGIIRDGIAEAFFSSDKDGIANLLDEAFGLSNDFAVVLNAAAEGKEALKRIEITPGKPINVMLAVKAESIEEAFKICGKPAAFEYKYDGFRVVISKGKGEIKLFTRRLEDVTKQFPDVIKNVSENVTGDTFILDSEIVGYDKKTGKYTPFQAISQRIRRKYDIDKLERNLPVEINVFDVIYYNGKNFLETKFLERRKLLEKIVKSKKFKIRLSEQIITDDQKKAEQFYKKALDAGEEGLMIKNLNVGYKQARRVGFIAKLKPSVKDLDLVITGAEYGSGKRGGWITSYYVSCINGENLLEVGKVSSGLKEKENDDGNVTYEEMTKMLKPLIIEEKGNYVKVKPRVVVSVTYQNIQKSPSYSSGYALRFPRITAYRPDRDIKDITSLKEIEKGTNAK